MRACTQLPEPSAQRVRWQLVQQPERLPVLEAVQQQQRLREQPDRLERVLQAWGQLQSGQRQLERKQEHKQRERRRLSRHRNRSLIVHNDSQQRTDWQRTAVQ